MEEVGRENFGELYDAYSQKIYRYIYYRTQHTQTAEDLTSSVFVFEDSIRYNRGFWIFIVIKFNWGLKSMVRYIQILTSVFMIKSGRKFWLT